MLAKASRQGAAQAMVSRCAARIGLSTRARFNNWLCQAFSDRSLSITTCTITATNNRHKRCPQSKGLGGKEQHMLVLHALALITLQCSTIQPVTGSLRHCQTGASQPQHACAMYFTNNAFGTQKATTTEALVLQSSQLRLTTDNSTTTTLHHHDHNSTTTTATATSMHVGNPDPQPFNNHSFASLVPVGGCSKLL